MLNKKLKRLFLALLLIVVSGFSALPAQAASQYFGLTPGVWMPHDTTSYYYDRHGVYSIDTSYDPGWSLSGTYGIKLDNYMRAEWELGYKQASARNSSDDSWVLTSMINCWWESPNRGVAPYFGGGIGYGQAHLASYDMYDATGGGITYQVGGGLNIPINRHGLSLDLGYRYFGFTSTTSDYYGSSNLDQSGSQISLGIRTKF